MNFPFRSAGLLLAFALLSQSATAGLFGPSTELLKGDALVAKLKAHQVVLSVGGGLLDIRTKSMAVGSFLVSFVVGSALASGGGAPANAQQMQQSMQANMQIATSFNQNLQVAMTQVASDQAAKPTMQIAKEGPIVIVGQQLMVSLLQEPGVQMLLATAAQPAMPADLQLRLSQPEWKLDFSLASSEYTLRYQIDASLYQKESDTVFYKESCKGEAPQKLALEDWERDDFSEVAHASGAIASRCMALLSTALSLRAASTVPASSPVTQTASTQNFALTQTAPVTATNQVDMPASPEAQAQQ